MIRQCVRWGSLPLAFWLSCPVFAQYFDSKKYGEHYEEEKVWAEAETILPEYPQPENLIEIYVSAATLHKFFVDAKSVGAGEDGVVRFTLVVNAAGGGSNVSYEGIRCQTRQRRVYAVGRNGNTWAKTRASRWSEISVSAANRQHAVLSHSYFCPGNVAIHSPDEGVKALRAGGHPDAIK